MALACSRLSDLACARDVSSGRLFDLALGSDFGE
jgi:hypothetical protein